MQEHTGKNDLTDIHAQWLLLKSGTMQFEEWRTWMVTWANSYNEHYAKNAEGMLSGKGGIALHPAIADEQVNQVNRALEGHSHHGQCP